MTMEYFNQDLQFYVAADHHCSYVQLINGVNESSMANCKMLTTAVNGHLKMLLYAIKQINKGE